MAEKANKFKRTVKKLARKTTKAVSKTVDTAKYSVKLKATEGDLNEKFEELGKLYYAYEKNKNEDAKAHLDKCLEEIEEIGKKLLEIRRELARAKGEIVCTKCGAYVSPNKDTCPSCNSTLERIEVVVAEPKAEPSGEDNGEE